MEKSRPRGLEAALIVLCFGAFTLYAMYFNGFGIDEDANGMILTVQAVGCMIVTIVLGLFGERINKISGIVIGLGLMGTAGILIGLLPKVAPESGYLLMLGFSILAGVGFIAIDLLMNGVVADIFPDTKNTLLPFIHAFYGVGAMLAPLFVTTVVKPEYSLTFALPYLFIGIASILICVALFFIRRKITPYTPYRDMAEIRSSSKGNPAQIFRDKRAWLYLLVCFLYLCFQTGLSTWLPTYGQRQLGLSFTDAGRMVTLYFLGALIMRFLSPLIYKKTPVRSFYILTLLLSGLLFIVFLLVPMSVAAAKIIIVVMGMLQGASVPALVILCCDTFPERSASASSIIVLGVSLSSMVIPPAMGALMISTGYVIPMLFITVCLFLSVLVLVPIQAMEPEPK